MIFLIGFAAIISTSLGGLFTIRFRDKLHLILGFSAGAVLAVALFDLLPEAISLAGKIHGISFITLFTAIGFSAFMILDRIFSIHQHDEMECDKSSHRGKLSAAALCFHSFLDGLGIGFAFKVSPAIGWIIATAVLVHDFSDGVNTVNIILKNHGGRMLALKVLMIDAIAPMIGIIATFFFVVSEPILGLILAIFAGLFLYIGASDLIPESHHNHPGFGTTAMTILGIATLYIVIRLAG